eukprot:2523863-Rhodomonas_salina.2
MEVGRHAPLRSISTQSIQSRHSASRLGGSRRRGTILPPSHPGKGVLGSTWSTSLAHLRRDDLIGVDFRILFRGNYLFRSPVRPCCTDPGLAVPNVTHSSRCNLVALPDDGRAVRRICLERVLALGVKSSPRSLTPPRKEAVSAALDVIQTDYTTAKAQRDAS